MKKFIGISLLTLTLAGCQSANMPATMTMPAAPSTNAQMSAQIMPFQNQSLSIDARVYDLVSRMTLEEKAAQMYDKAPAIPRLGVPAYVYWNEALHGVARAGTATVFPQAIGMAATFDEDLMKRVATTISDESRAKHHDFERKGISSIYTGLTFWSPNINIFRDPRWGRGQETYGEDPYLTGRMAVNFVNGLQGDDAKYLKSVATIKHYAVHSGPESTRHTDDYDVSAKDLNETYLPAFAMAIREAKPASLMCAYNAFRGQPACANTFLMQDTLRGRLGFDGFVVSDCGAIGDIHRPQHHGYTKTKAEAAAVAVKAGTELVCGDDEGSVYAALPEAVVRDLIDEATIDQAVKRIFTARFKLGMFDDDSQVPFADIPMRVVGSKDHLALTQEAARKSLVLLKNDGILPLKPGRKVAVIGPNADNFDVLIGNYNGKPVQPETALQSLRERLGTDNVAYAPGSSLGGSVYSHYATVPAAVFSHSVNGSSASGLIASYYRGEEATGTPVRTATAENIDFEWSGSPATEALDEAFTAVWDGNITPAVTGRYRFAPGMDVMIDGREVGNNGVNMQAGKSYAIKASVTRKPEWHSNAIQPVVALQWINLDRDLAAEAMAAADKSDVILFFSGLSAKLEGEEMSVDVPGFDGGDRTSLDLPAEQMALLKRLQATGKPVVLVNFSGSAVNMAWPKRNLPAIVQGFYPGEATGPAITQLLMGDYSPAGRLPVTFYENLDGLPAFDDYDMRNRTYKYYTGTPVYPFGYGLSYVRFDYSADALPTTHDTSRPLTLSVNVRNTGKMASDEVVEVYAARAAEGAPIRSLVKFKRITIGAGKSEKVALTLNPDQLTYVDKEGKNVPYTGPVTFTIGSGQPGYVDAGSIVRTTINFAK